MKRPLVVFGLVVMGCIGAAGAEAATRRVVLPDLAQPKCEAPLQRDEAGTSCVLPDGLDPKQYTKDRCPTASGFSFGTECQFDATRAAKPVCDKSVSNLIYDKATKTCMLEVGDPSSGAGDYVGDCFKIVGTPAGMTLQKGRYYTVTDQADTQDDDRRLTVVEGAMNWIPIPGLFGCSATSGPKQEVGAASLMQNGAQRLGWAYGALTMPYKYYPGSKSFVTGLPPIGAYMGWRVGRAGSGVTIATAMTLSTVRVDTVDPKNRDSDGNPTVIGTAEAAALSAALGLVFDVSKRPGFKPIKAGFFIGQDRVNRSETVSYRNDGKTWIALQIGFDFTDN